MTGEKPRPDLAAAGKPLSGTTFTLAAPLWSTKVVAILEALPAS
jgi:adenosylmethionine-8-amino-7-oxononanoate aminotransferase